MDTSNEESSMFSQLEECSASPIGREAQLDNHLLASTTPSSLNKNSNANPNALSPFSSLTSGIATPKLSPFDEKSKEEKHEYCNQQSETSGAQNIATKVSSDPNSQVDSTFNHVENSQESGSTWPSPFSSPVSSPHSERADCKLSITNGQSKTSISNFGTFLHPGTSTSQNTAEQEKQESPSSKKYFVHPSTSENIRNSQSSSSSTVTSYTSSTCAPPGQRVLPQPRSTRNSNPNLLKKLMGREILGGVRKNPANPKDPQIRLFSRLPARLAFCLRDAIPHSAIENGHIFMGFSKCGQFLLSYTQTEADVDLVTLVPHFHYHYRLHWWLFIPYKKAKKVAEVTLFSNTSAAGNLHISFCQWPRDNKKVLVFGCQIGEAGESTFASAPGYNISARPCYITVTAIPSLDACKECVKVAANYEEDEMAAQWNSCVRLSCIDHGMTVHTCFDLVPPYPKFEPRVSMKRDSWVLINSGNFLHAMHFDLETLKPKEQGSVNKDQYSSVSGGVIDSYLNSKQYGMAFSSTYSPSRPPGITSPQYHNSFALARWSELRISVSEFSSGAHGYGNSSQPHYLPVHPSASPYQSHGFFSPTQSQYSPSVHAGAPSSIATTDSSDCESECSSYTTAHSYSKHKKKSMNPERLERVAKFVDQLSPPQLGIKPNPLHPRRFKRIHVYSSDNQRSQVGESDMGNIELQAGNAVEHKEEGNKRKRLANAADKAYELTDDNFDEGSVQEKLSTFRKKRLAEKKYEFTDEDSENIPLPKLRSQQQKIKKEDTNICMSCPTTSNQRSSMDSDDDKQVLRTLSNNQNAESSSKDHILTSETR